MNVYTIVLLVAVLFYFVLFHLFAFALEYVDEKSKAQKHSVFLRSNS